MFAALIHWSIKPEHVDDFLQHWKTVNTVADRSQLIGEFVCKPYSREDFNYIDWQLEADQPEESVSFVTIGLWSEAEAFREQVARHFNLDDDPKFFEAHRRRRVVLHPEAWRTGAGLLPTDDSPGVN